MPFTSPLFRLFFSNTEKQFMCIHTAHTNGVHMKKIEMLWKDFRVSVIQKQA